MFVLMNSVFSVWLFYIKCFKNRIKRKTVTFSILKTYAIMNKINKCCLKLFYWWNRHETYLSVLISSGDWLELVHIDDGLVKHSTTHNTDTASGAECPLRLRVVECREGGRGRPIYAARCWLAWERSWDAFSHSQPAPERASCAPSALLPRA